MANRQQQFVHPYDTVVSASLRFVCELIAWVSGPWAMALISGWLVVPTAIILVLLPAVFSTPNDKRQVVVATPGPVRLLIETFLVVTACTAPWFVWSQAWALAAVVVVFVGILAGRRRIAWLLKGAPASPVS